MYRKPYKKEMYRKSYKRVETQTLLLRLELMERGVTERDGYLVYSYYS